MREIPLGKSGKVALVDDADAEMVAGFKWFYAPRRGGLEYAGRQKCGGGKQQTILMHRLILGAQPGQLVDHANGNGLDNRRQNLRIATHAQNAANCRSHPKPRSTHNFRGVCEETYCRGRWKAYIRNGHGLRHIGNFPTPELAARAYDRAALARWGEFARTNFPREQYAPVAANG